MARLTDLSGLVINGYVLPTSMSKGSSRAVSIEPVEGFKLSARDLAEIDEIFFSSSSRTTFASEAERSAFHERWLGRYLAMPGDVCLIARAARPHGRIIGYLVGSFPDLAQGERFADLAYVQAFAKASAKYPAHLHVNVLEPQRSAGVGALLVEAFVTLAGRAGAPGVHIVTGEGMRNVRFYERLGFREIARARNGANTVVFLGRPIHHSAQETGGPSGP